MLGGDSDDNEKSLRFKRRKKEGRKEGLERENQAGRKAGTGGGITMNVERGGGGGGGW